MDVLSSSFVLQGGKWLSYHIDDLHLERDQMPSLDQLKTTSVSGLFEGALHNASLEQHEDIMEVDDDAEDSVVMDADDARGEYMDWDRDGTERERKSFPREDEDVILSPVCISPSSEDMDVVSQKLSEGDAPVCSEVKMLREAFGSQAQEVPPCDAQVIARGPRTPAEAVHDTMRRQVI